MGSWDPSPKPHFLQPGAPKLQDICCGSASHQSLQSLIITTGFSGSPSLCLPHFLTSPPSRIALQISVTPGDVPCQEPPSIQSSHHFAKPPSFLPKPLDTIFFRSSFTCCFARRPLSHTSAPYKSRQPWVWQVLRLPPTGPEGRMHFSVLHPLGLYPLRIPQSPQNVCHLRDPPPPFPPRSAITS